MPLFKSPGGPDLRNIHESVVNWTCTKEMPYDNEGRDGVMLL